jgi:hypothetical protein
VVVIASSTIGGSLAAHRHFECPGYILKLNPGIELSTVRHWRKNWGKTAWESLRQKGCESHGRPRGPEYPCQLYHHATEILRWWERIDLIIPCWNKILVSWLLQGLPSRTNTPHSTPDCYCRSQLVRIVLFRRAILLLLEIMFRFLSIVWLMARPFLVESHFSITGQWASRFEQKEWCFSRTRVGCFVQVLKQLARPDRNQAFWCVRLIIAPGN